MKHDTKFCIWIRHSSDKVHQDKKKKISLQSILTFGNICHKLTLRYLIKGWYLIMGDQNFFFQYAIKVWWWGDDLKNQKKGKIKQGSLNTVGIGQKIF